jgi:TIR domain
MPVSSVDDTPRSYDPPVPDHPRVFISHSSADKERFVLPFAERLRERGIDAWVDQWEMLPGDSLVESVFGAIDQAEAAVIVLSRQSLDSRWVRQELNASVIKRINETFGLIPVVLDSLSAAELPLELRTLVFESVPDVSNLDGVVDRVVRAVFGTADRPPLGPPPAHAGLVAARIDGLDRIDSLVLKLLGDEALRAFGTLFDTVETVPLISTILGTAEDDVLNSVEVLDSVHLIAIHRTNGPRPQNMQRFRLTAAGLDLYARCYIAGMTKWSTASWPASPAGQPTPARSVSWPSKPTPQDSVQHVVEELDARGLLTLSKAFGPAASSRRFMNLSVALRRVER